MSRFRNIYPHKYTGGKNKVRVYILFANINEGKDTYYRKVMGVFWNLEETNEAAKEVKKKLDKGEWIEIEDYKVLPLRSCT